MAAAVDGVPDRSLRYRVLLLDWDGTVRDSVASIVGCALAALEASGFAGDATVVRDTIGLDIGRSVARWVPEGGADDHRRVLESYRTLWIDDWHARARLFPGVEQALTTLARRGHWLTVATGKSRAGLDRDMASLSEDLRGLFLASRTADETASKPSPDMVHELLDELGVRPARALVVGDSVHDLQMAANAGCDAVAVLGGASTEEALRAAEPAAVLGGLGELPAWLVS